MSIYTSKTGLTSILKPYKPSSRENAKNAAVYKVKFQMPPDTNVVEILENVLNSGNYIQYYKFISFLRETPSLSDDDFLTLIKQCRKAIYLLKPQFSILVETILSFQWIDRNDVILKEFSDFYVDLLVAHNKFTSFGIRKLLLHWIPSDNDKYNWENGSPNEMIRQRLENTHNLVNRLLTVIPLTYNVIRETIENIFPYHTKPSHMIAGYLHNLLWLLDYRTTFSSYIIELIFKKLLILDVNAPRHEIENTEYADNEDNEDEELADNFEVFKMEDIQEDDSEKMKHPIANSLDVCMGKMFEFINKFITTEENKRENTAKDGLNLTSLFKIILTAFENILLPSHNPHHVQFLIFYCCSFKSYRGEKYLDILWSKVSNPTIPAAIRQTSIGYIASYLARSKFTSLNLLKHYLKELTQWAHQYIQRCDPVRSNVTLKANLVFFSACQAIFYIIAFRSRDLTRDKKNLIFLQSLQLSSIVSCNLNPLRVCLPTVATAFAGVTRTYQLAYCHTILERNARQKLATIYGHDTVMPEEYLDTFFPFDPYLLKRSKHYIEPNYLQYRTNEAEEEYSPLKSKRARQESETGDEIDDFLNEKRHCATELSKSQEREIQFTYGLSPGFHT